MTTNKTKQETFRSGFKLTPWLVLSFPIWSVMNAIMY